jgi:uncharacterized CHY-type Zn-finger protein
MKYKCSIYYKCSGCLKSFSQTYLGDYETSKISGKPICRKCNNDERERLGMIRLPLEHKDKLLS